MKKIISIAFTFAAAGFLASAGMGKVQAKSAKAEDEIVINPFADYRFQDADDLGKDTSGNGFDLKMSKTSTKDEAIYQKTEGEQKFLSVNHDVAPDGQLKTTGGGWLYAPQLYGNSETDMSDLITGDYTVSVTMRSDYQCGFGNRYALNFGRYCSSVLLVPWKGGVTVYYGNTDLYEGVNDPDAKQSWLQSQEYVIHVPEERNNNWVTITLVGYADDGKVRAFLDGNFVTEISVPGGRAKLTNQKAGEEASSYTFAIGGQCDIRGGSVDPLIGAICDYKNVTLYDCALSDQNISAIVAGNNAVISKQAAEKQNYVTSIADVNTADYDLEITNDNALNDVIKDQIGSKKVKATTSDGNSRSYNTFWYPTEDGKIKGKLLVDDAINVQNKQVSMDYKYVAKITYDANKVDVTEVKLDNQPYTLGDAITSSRHTIKFILTPKNGATISTVIYDDMDMEPEEDEDIAEGSYFYIIPFTKGAHITVVAEGGSVPGGETGGGETGGGSKGCGGSVTAASALVAAFGLTAAGLLFRKKED